MQVTAPVLYLQIDNCFRDCKNIYIFGFCGLLVMAGVFKKVIYKSYFKRIYRIKFK